MISRGIAFMAASSDASHQKQKEETKIFDNVHGLLKRARWTRNGRNARYRLPRSGKYFPAPRVFTYVCVRVWVCVCAQLNIHLRHAPQLLPLRNERNLMRRVSACEDAGALFILCVTADVAIFPAKIYETRAPRNGDDKWLSETLFLYVFYRCSRASVACYDCAITNCVRPTDPTTITEYS